MESRKRKPRAGAGGHLVEPAGLESSTGYLLARVGTESRRRWARTLVELNLTPHHYSALMALGHEGAMSQHQLSRHVGIDPRNAVPVIDQLESAGLVDRKPDLTDRRRYAVTLTGAGTAVIGELRHLALDAERELLAPLTAAEHQTLHGLLTRLFRAINQDSAGA